ncbi:MAG: class I SAM-dependent methyltransferase [Deltaproteobacteria bacterium]|nr:class I SAM-dependent methyltransferase [Deltaproteobacteria bacterium]
MRVLELTAALIADLPSTGPTDPIAFYRRPMVGWLFRERINRGLGLLGDRRFKAALEVGYGAGAVQLALDPAVAELHGIDLDADPTEVSRLLGTRGCPSELRQGSVLELPYEAERFDLVVCFSVIEHLADYAVALREMARVLKPTGLLLLGMPSVSPLMEIGFRLIGFKGIEDHHVTTPAAVSRSFVPAGLQVTRSSFLDVPTRRPLGLRLYHNWLLRKQP